MTSLWIQLITTTCNNEDRACKQIKQIQMSLFKQKQSSGIKFSIQNLKNRGKKLILEFSAKY